MVIIDNVIGYVDVIPTHIIDTITTTIIIIIIWHLQR